LGGGIIRTPPALLLLLDPAVDLAAVDVDPAMWAYFFGDEKNEAEF